MEVYLQYPQDHSLQPRVFKRFGACRKFEGLGSRIPWKIFACRFPRRLNWLNGNPVFDGQNMSKPRVVPAFFPLRQSVNPVNFSNVGKTMP